MNEAILVFYDYILENGVAGAFALLIFTLIRPIAMLYGFTSLQWAFGQNIIIRVTLSLVLGVPMTVVNIQVFSDVIANSSRIELFGIAFVEISIGFCIGIITTLSFIALQYAGAITDQMRGESDSGFQSPEGGTLSTFGKLYVIIAFLLFASLGGFYWLVQSLYTSYVLWPLAGGLPQLDMTFLIVFLELFTESLARALLVAGPLLILMYTVELMAGVAARLGQKLNFYNLAFPVKNIAAMLILPVTVLWIWFVAGEFFAENLRLSDLLLELF